MGTRAGRLSSTSESAFSSIWVPRLEIKVGEMWHLNQYDKTNRLKVQHCPSQSI
ncbi:unnamed protein product, partial [Nesidiocoris tenuis]